MALPQEKTYTVEDILALPENVRAELIDGQIYYQATPTRTHQRIIGWLYRKISGHIESKNGTCETIIAPFAVFLSENNKNYLEPDLMVICDESKITEEGCKGAPDLIIEVVSPSTRRNDYNQKLFLYRTAGVREYWIVDREKNRITAYDLEKEDSIEYTFSDNVKVGMFDDLEIDFSELDI